MQKSVLLRGVVFSLTLLLAACYSTGNVFKVSGVNALVVGQTTYAEAVELLQAEPVNYYRQSNGNFLAFWNYSRSLVPDALYIDPQLLLEFNAHQVLTAIKKKPAVTFDGTVDSEKNTGS